MVYADCASARVHRHTDVSKGLRRLQNCAQVLPSCAISISRADNCTFSGHDCCARSGARRRRRLAQLPRVVALWLACASLLVPAPAVSSAGVRPEQSYGCPNCQIPHEAIRQYTLNEIKHSILSKLGFETVPNITNRLPTTENMLINTFMNNVANKPQDGQHIRHKPYLHEIQGDESPRDDEDDDKMRNTLMVAVAKSCTSTESYCKIYKNHYPLTFVFEPKTTKAKVLTAKLSFYQRQLTSMGKISDADMKVNITIYKLTTRHHYVNILSTEEKLSTSGKWIEIDVKEHLEKHFKENNSLNLSLVIIATHTNKEIVAKLVTEIQTEEEPLFPFLQIRTDEQRINKRSKRSNHMDCKDEDKNTKCCRYPLTVDFDAFQWDFIIAPRKYEAYYCAGECGPLSNQKYPHTHLLTLTPPTNNTHWPITPCCTPRKMGPISMVFYGTEGNIHFGILPGMVVQRCGCA